MPPPVGRSPRKNSCRHRFCPIRTPNTAWISRSGCRWGVTLGALAAVFQNSWLDHVAVGIAMGAQVLPNFVMAPILVLSLTLGLGWLPGGGWEGGDGKHQVMPVIAMATAYLASIARITRSSMPEVLTQNHIGTATAKGLPASKVILRHALKPALIPVLSYLGPTFVSMITGSVVIDMFLFTGGIGKFFVDAALNRDGALMMGVTLRVGVLTIVFNQLVDVRKARRPIDRVVAWRFPQSTWVPWPPVWQASTRSKALALGRRPRAVPAQLGRHGPHRARPDPEPKVACVHRGRPSHRRPPPFAASCATSCRTFRASTWSAPPCWSPTSS